jgi:antitoxin StbD
MNQIFQRFEADVGVSVTDLKRNAAAVVSASKRQAVAILNHNKVVAYVISPEVWEYVQELHDDAKIVEMIEAQKDEEPIPVNIDDL